MLSNGPQEPVQPDIDYYPSIDKYRSRTEQRLRDGGLDTVLREGLPQFIDSPASWTASIIDEADSWLYYLSPEDIEEIKEATRRFQALGLPLSELAPETFPLPYLKTRIRAWSRGLHYGLGFVVVRGFPVDNLTAEERVIVFAGLSSYVGNVRARQDQGGAVLSHVTDMTRVHADAIGNPAFTAGSQAMHTDPGEIIAMFCVDTAAEGGESRIASSTALYNQLASQRPDLINTLSEDWILDGFGGVPKFTKRPILFVTPDNQVIVQFVRRALTGFREVPRSSDIPPITEAQAEALDALHFKALEQCISIRFEPGDFQFLNNLNILHSRTSFRDGDNHKRHLLRMWLRDEEYGWLLPKQLTETAHWKRLFELERAEQSFPLEPQVKSEKFDQPVRNESHC